MPPYYRTPLNPKPLHHLNIYKYTTQEARQPQDIKKPLPKHSRQLSIRTMDTPFRGPTILALNFSFQRVISETICPYNQIDSMNSDQQRTKSPSLFSKLNVPATPTLDMPATPTLDRQPINIPFSTLAIQLNGPETPMLDMPATPMHDAPETQYQSPKSVNQK